MSITSKSLPAGTTVTVAAAGTAVAGPTVPDNAHTMMAKNLHATAEIYIDQTIAAGNPVTATAAAIRLGPGETVVVPLGVLSERPSEDGAGIVYDSDTNGATVHVSFICGASP